MGDSREFSLLDPLIVRCEHDQPLDDPVAALLLDLGDLLRTPVARAPRTEDDADVPGTGTVIDFGVPDLIDLANSGSSADGQPGVDARLASEVRRALELFEPRLQIKSV